MDDQNYQNNRIWVVLVLGPRLQVLGPFEYREDAEDILTSISYDGYNGMVLPVEQYED